MLTRRTVVLAKVENPYGADSVPTPAANALLAYDVDIKPAGEAIARNPLRSTLSNLPFRRGTKVVDVSFKTELKGTGSRGALPAFGWEGDLFRACGMAETVTNGVSIVYAPVSTGFESCTLYVYKDGIFHKVRGCKGSFSIDLQVGQAGMVAWKFQGLYDSPVDASPGAQTFSDLEPPIVVGSGLSVGGYAPVATKLELDINNTLAVRKSMNAADGIVGVEITGRDPQGSFDPEAVLEAIEDFWAKWESAEAVELAIGPLGATPGNVIEINAPAVQYREITWGDRDGQSVYTVPIGLAMSNGDDELSITFS